MPAFRAQAWLLVYGGLRACPPAPSQAPPSPPPQSSESWTHNSAEAPSAALTDPATGSGLGFCSYDDRNPQGGTCSKRAGAWPGIHARDTVSWEKVGTGGLPRSTRFGGGTRTRSEACG